jgi:hypothetical protein
MTNITCFLLYAKSRLKRKKAMKVERGLLEGKRGAVMGVEEEIVTWTRYGQSTLYTCMSIVMKHIRKYQKSMHILSTP